jgi:hypothetical protein
MPRPSDIVKEFDEKSIDQSDFKQANETKTNLIIQPLAMDKPQISHDSTKGKNLESPLKIAKNHFSDMIDNIAGSPDRVSSLINKVTPSPKSKKIIKAEISED